jgi:hypothetical protein
LPSWTKANGTWPPCRQSGSEQIRSSGRRPRLNDCWESPDALVREAPGEEKEEDEDDGQESVLTHGRFRTCTFCSQNTLPLGESSSGISSTIESRRVHGLRIVPTRKAAPIVIGVSSVNGSRYSFSNVGPAQPHSEPAAVREMRAVDDAEYRNGFWTRSFTSTNHPGKNHLETAHVACSHLFNHQTHHRGQVPGMRSQTSMPPPALDLHRIFNP